MALCKNLFFIDNKFAGNYLGFCLELVNMA